MSESSTRSSDNEKSRAKNPRRRQVHNEVERRRKDKINSWILKISELLPDKELCKKSKISILEQTVSYIKELVTERNKLLANEISEVHACEIKSLKKSMVLLKEQNDAYLKLLQEANIDLPSLPKKVKKYSNKFTQEMKEALLKKLKLSSNENGVLESPPKTQVLKPIKNAQFGGILTSPTPITNNVPVVTFNIPGNNSMNECSPNLVVVSNPPKISPILNIAPCRIGNTMVNAGGVTSALPPLPVMSSTLGSSFGHIHSKTMQLILLPNGAGLLQPSIIPSNISVLAPTLQSSFSIVVPHSVPVSSSSQVGTDCAGQVTNISENISEVTNKDDDSGVSDSIVSDGIPSSQSSTPVSNVPSDVETESCMGEKETISTTPSALDKSILVTSDIPKKPIRNRPQSLQVLSANKIIALASKFQLPCKASMLNKASEKDLALSSETEVSHSEKDALTILPGRSTEDKDQQPQNQNIDIRKSEASSNSESGDVSTNDCNDKSISSVTCVDTSNSSNTQRESLPQGFQLVCVTSAREAINSSNSKNTNCNNFQSTNEELNKVVDRIENVASASGTNNSPEILEVQAQNVTELPLCTENSSVNILNNFQVNSNSRTFESQERSTGVQVKPSFTEAVSSWSTTVPTDNVVLQISNNKEPCIFNSAVSHNDIIPPSIFLHNQVCKDKLPHDRIILSHNKKLKSLVDPLSESVNSFQDYTFEVLNSSSEIDSNQKCNDPKPISSTSDILAKAAESIFGNDAFSSMEVQTLSQEIESNGPFDGGVTNFSNSGLEVPSSSTHTSNTIRTTFSNNVTGNGRYLMSNAGIVDNLSKFEQSYRVRKNASLEGEPQAKKIKEYHCPVVVPSTVSMNTQKVNSTTHSALSNVTQEKTIFFQSMNCNSNSQSTLTDTTLISFSGKQMQYPNNNNSNVTHPIKFLCQNKNSGKAQNSSFTENAQTFQPSTSDSCGLITHPVNSLFNSSSSNNEVNPSKNSYGSDKCDGSKDPNKEMTGVKKVSLPVSKECSVAKQISQNELVSTSNNTTISSSEGNRLYFGAPPITSIIQPLNIPSITYSSQSKFISASQVPSGSDYTAPPPLLSRDPNPHHLPSFDINMPVVSTSAGEMNKVCQLPTSSNSLSHSLCSLLKETPSNATFGSMVPVSNPMVDSTTVSKSKYSALSLISNQTCIGPSISRTDSSGIATSLQSTLESQTSSSVVCRNSKSSLSYSAERLIQNQYTGHDKEHCKNNMTNLSTSKKSNCIPNVQELYKTNTFVPGVSSDISVPLPLPPVTSFPSFPPGFAMCDGRTSTTICNSTLHPYQDVPISVSKENIFPPTSIIPPVQNNATLNQNSTSFSKSNSSLPFNVENHGNIYNSCNFLQHTKPNLDIMKASDNNSCFQSIFVNSNYPQQVQKQNYCPFIEQPSSDNSDKSFTLMPPAMPTFHNDKEVDHRPPLVSNMPQNSSNYLGNIFYDTASCAHESNIPSNKPSIVRPTQDSYLPLRNGSSQHKNVLPNKAKTKKSKQSTTLEGNLYKAATFAPNANINFNVFTVPDLSSSKSSVSHVPNTYSKNMTQTMLPTIRESSNQQGKIADTVLGSVMHTAFNHGLHQQNESFLNLNFQPPSWSGDNSLAVPPPPPPPLTLTSSSCTPTSKQTRSFTSGAHPVPNFNLSNILQDMGSSSANNDINISAIKFPTSVPQRECHSSSVPNNSVPHQSPLYTPHSAVVPNALLNSPLSRNQTSTIVPTMPSNISTIPQTPPFAPTQTPPFRNVIHSLSFSRS